MTFKSFQRLTLAIILTCFACAQPEPPQLEQKLDGQFAHLLTSGRPGFAIGVIQNGEVLLNKGYGLANVEHLIPFTGETISDIGSVAKHITVTGILTLVDQGLLSLKDPVVKHLPELQHLGTKFTIRHLITHTSGLPDVYALVALRGWRSGDQMDQNYALRFMKNQRSLNFLPGEQYMYSNTAYMLLAEIVERLSQMEFEAYMRQKLFEPLGMTHTYIMDKQGEIYPQMAESYVKGEDGKYYRIFDNSTLQGAGGMYSSITDMLAWLDNFRTSKIPVVGRLTERMILNNGDTLNYALGVNVDTHRGLKRISHSGSSAGYRTKIFYYPEEKLGIIIKSNTPEMDYEELGKIENLVLDELLSDLQPLSEEAEESSEIIPVNITPGNLKKYEGKYFSREMDLVWNVSSGEKGVVISTYYIDFPLYKPVAKDQFSSDDGGTKVTFRRNGVGEIDGLIYSDGRVKEVIFEKIE